MLFHGRLWNIIDRICCHEIHDSIVTTLFARCRTKTEFLQYLMKLLFVSCLLFTVLHQGGTFHLDDYQKERREKSRQMIYDLRQEIIKWPFDPSNSEENALVGIKRLIEMNSSHPITEGISLVHFVKKPSVQLFKTGQCHLEQLNYRGIVALVLEICMLIVIGLLICRITGC